MELKEDACHLFYWVEFFPVQLFTRAISSKIKGNATVLTWENFTFT